MKEIKLPMKFNPGLQKYEPKLPILKKVKKIESKSRMDSHHHGYNSYYNFHNINDKICYIT